MGQDSKIEWTDHTFNPWRGCTKVSAGCAHCYAETLSGRNPGTLGIWGKHGTRVIAAESYWKQPHKWNREAEQAGERRRVFCASLADVFEGMASMPAEAFHAVTAARIRLFHLITQTPWLDWLLLTKRPENIIGQLPPDWGNGYPNVWLGTSVEDQVTANKRIPVLLDVPARVRFLSCEPLLGAVDLDSEDVGGLHALGCGDFTCTCGNRGIDWVIVGGESGPGARPMHPEWARSLRNQCTEAGAAFHFKQWGEYRPGIPSDDVWCNAPQHWWDNDHTNVAYRVGKKAAGRLLDGRTWDELPAVEVPA